MATLCCLSSCLVFLHFQIGTSLIRYSWKLNERIKMKQFLPYKLQDCLYISKVLQSLHMINFESKKKSWSIIDFRFKVCFQKFNGLDFSLLCIIFLVRGKSERIERKFQTEKSSLINSWILIRFRYLGMNLYYISFFLKLNKVLTENYK